MTRFLFLLLLCLGAPVWAAGEADLFAAQLARQLSPAPVVRADFVQEKQIAAFKKPLVTRGKMVFARNQGVIWKIESPLRVTYVLSEDHIVEMAENSPPQVRTARDVPGLAQIGRIFRSLLGAQAAPLAEIFSVDGDSRAERWKLALSPKPGPVAQYMKQIRLEGARHVERIRIDEANGDSTAITFSNPREDEPLNADEQSLLRKP